VLFDEPVADSWNDVDVEVVIDDVQSSSSSGFSVKTLADWINPYTYTFVAPGICGLSPVAAGRRKGGGAKGGGACAPGGTVQVGGICRGRKYGILEFGRLCGANWRLHCRTDSAGICIT